jgi:hypothetical protein
MSLPVGRGFTQLPLLVLLVALGASCSSTQSGSDGAGASSSYGAASSSGGSPTYVAPKCEQGCQDFLVGFALDDTLWFLWNQKLAGHPVGVQDIMGTCPLGGTAHITGMDGASNGTTTTDIQFALDACENSNTQYHLSFTGTVTMEGSFDSDTFAAETFSAPGLDVSGDLKWRDKPTIDQSCDVIVNQRGTGDSAKLTGTVCGRDFDETSLLPAGGSGTTTGGTGSGGASATAGTSGVDCSCFCPDGSSCTAKSNTSNPCGVDTDGIPNACACPVDCK